MTEGEIKSKLDKSVEFLQSELAKIRTGRATPAMIENVNVDAYESKMSLVSIASVSVPDSQNLIVAPFDQGLAKNISNAINTSDLNLNSVVDGNVVRVPIPELSEERRKELSKQVTTKVEEVKGSIRNIRQEAKKELDTKFNNKEISEDEKFTDLEKANDLAKEYTEKVEDLGKVKKNELLKI